MFRLYLLVALRNLIQHRVPSVVNILGLAIGMTAFILIIQYVRYEFSYGKGCSAFLPCWLQHFAYRINLGWWFFVGPVLLVVVIAILTVSSQVIRTANVNPAESLRYE